MNTQIRPEHYFVMYQCGDGITLSYSDHQTWSEAKKDRNYFFAHTRITHCWIEKRIANEPWNTRRFGEVLKRERIKQ